MSDTLDEIDRHILRELQRNADQSYEALGEQIGLSRNATWRRIKRLEDDGVIAARVALVSPQALNLSLTVFIQVRTSRHDPEWLHRFTSVLKDIPEITGAYRMSGDLDYLLRARVQDMPDYDRLYQKLIRRVELADVTASFVMEDLKDTTALPV